jgi:hypothetical protein
MQPVLVLRDDVVRGLEPDQHAVEDDERDHRRLEAPVLDDAPGELLH